MKHRTLTLTYWLSIATFIILPLFLSSCGDGSEISRDEIFSGKLPTGKDKTSPKGVKVKSNMDIPDAILPEIDRGLDDLFRIAGGKPYNYSGFRLHQSYTVWLMKRSPHCINPAFLVNGNGSPYDQTEWDKDREVGRVLLCAAGMLVRNGGGSNDIGLPGMLITNDIGGARTISRYEGEHNLLLEVDRAKYNATMYHVENGHPILPDPATNNLIPETESTAYEFDGRLIDVTK